MATEYTEQDIKHLTQVAERWAGKVLDKEVLNKEQAKHGIEWLYKFCELSKPEVLFTSSPLAMQLVANTDNELSEVDLQKEVISLGRSVAELEKDLVVKHTGKNLEYYQTSAYGNISDYTWVAYYDYLNEKGDPQVSPDFADYKNLLDSNIYDTIQFKDVCIVCGMPEVFELNSRNDLHCEDGPALAWSDGYELFFINGVLMPRNYVMTPANKLDANLVIKETNVERRQFLVSKIGYNKVFKTLGGTTLESINAVELYKKYPIGDYYQHGDVLIKPEGDKITTIEYKNLLKEVKDRLGNINYSLVNLNLGDERVRPFLKMTNASLPDEEHLEPVPVECTNVFEAICWRNQMEYLPCKLS